MANYPDEDPQSGTGPKWWRSIYTALSGIFQGGPLPGKQIILAVGANDRPAAQAAAMSMYRAKMQAADAAARDRIEQTRRKRSVYEQCIQEFVEEKLRNGFHPQNYARMFMTLHVSSNVMRRIIHETSVLYENPAKRKLQKEDDETPLPVPPPPPALPSGDAPPEAEPGDKEDPTEDAAEPAKADDAKPEVPASKKKGPAPLPMDGEAPPTDPNSPLQTGAPDVDRLAQILQLTGAPEEEKGPFEELMEAYDWDVLLDKVEKMCMFCPVVWVRPYVVYEYVDEMVDDTEQPADESGQYPKKPSGQKVPNAETGELCYILYTPETAGCVTHPSDPTRMVAWYYWAEELYQDGDQLRTRKVIHFYDDNVYMKFDAKWELLYGPEKNLEGAIPAAAFRINLPDVNSYYEDGVGNDLFEATIEICCLKTMQNARFKDGAFKQLVIQSGDNKAMADQVMGGPTPIFTGDEGTASVLDMTPALKDMTDTWRARADDLAVTYGIDLAEFKGEGQPQSGFAKKLSRDKILKESRRRRKFFAKSEQELYRLTALQLKENPIPQVTGDLDPDALIETDFSEPTFEEDPKLQSQVDALELEFNAVSVIDVLRRKNPDLSDIDLVKLAHRNQEINKVFMTTDQSQLIKLLALSGTGAGASVAAGQKAGNGGPPSPGGKPPPFGGNNNE